MESLEFNYENHTIQFSVHPGQDNVMVNATEMAKVFGKRIDFFLKTGPTKEFIKALKDHLKNEAEFPPTGGNSTPKIIQTKGHMGTYFHRILALKFAAWLSPEFELWVFATIDTVLYGGYREWQKAEQQKLDAQLRLEQKREELLKTYPELESFLEMESAVKEMNRVAARRLSEIKNQLKLEFND